LAARRFPPPWTVEELDACFVVTDSAGQKLAYVYFQDEPGRHSTAKFSLGLIPDRWYALLVGAVIFGRQCLSWRALVVHLLS
jgi:hypothetical protein